MTTTDSRDAAPEGRARNALSIEDLEAHARALRRSVVRLVEKVRVGYL